MPPQGDLLGLVDDAHAAASYLPDDPVVTQLLKRRGCYAGILREVSPLAHPGLVVLHQQQRREQRMDPLGPLRKALGVLDGLRALAETVALQELLGQSLYRVAFIARTIRGHGPCLSLDSRSFLGGPASRG